MRLFVIDNESAVVLMHGDDYIEYGIIPPMFIIGHRKAADFIANIRDVINEGYGLHLSNNKVQVVYQAADQEIRICFGDNVEDEEYISEIMQIDKDDFDIDFRIIYEKDDNGQIYATGEFTEYGFEPGYDALEDIEDKSKNDSCTQNNMNIDPATNKTDFICVQVKNIKDIDIAYKNCSDKKMNIDLYKDGKTFYAIFHSSNSKTLAALTMPLCETGISATRKARAWIMEHAKLICKDYQLLLDGMYKNNIEDTWTNFVENRRQNGDAHRQNGQNKGCRK